MTRESEVQILNNYAERLREQGYDVYLEPAPKMLPPFLAQHRPDAVAFGQPKNLIIEVTRRSSNSQRRLRELRQRFEGQEDWELKVLFVSGSAPDSVDLSISTSEILAQANLLERLVGEGFDKPSLLSGWALLEAAGRMLEPAELAKPQSPARLVEVLASEGYITAKQGEELRAIYRKRNSIAHGGFDVDIKPAELMTLVQVIKALLLIVVHHR